MMVLALSLLSMETATAAQEQVRKPVTLESYQKPLDDLRSMVRSTLPRSKVGEDKLWLESHLNTVVKAQLNDFQEHC